MDISNALVKNFDFFYEELIEALATDCTVRSGHSTALRLISSNEIKLDYDTSENSLAILTRNTSENEQQVELPLDALERMSPNEATRCVGEAMLQLVPELKEKLFAQAS